jgi:hypothetical protein
MGETQPGRETDIWLWDGSSEYEGIVAKLTEPGFTAHVRENRSASARGGTGRRFNTTFFDLQRQFVGRRFLAYCKLAGDGELLEAEITTVQRSSAVEYDFFLCGRFRPLEEHQKEALRKMSARGVGGIISERLGPI